VALVGLRRRRGRGEGGEGDAGNDVETHETSGCAEGV
jgi:hypothetical protein